MSESVWKAVGYVGVVLMLASAIVSAVVPGCMGMIECTSGEVYMKCHWTFVAAIPASLVSAIAFVCAALAKSAEARRFSIVLALVSIVALALLPSDFLIGICAHADSGCHMKAAVVWVLAACSAVVGLVMLVKADPEQASRPKMHEL